jgi:hypothetical protein
VGGQLGDLVAEPLDLGEGLGGAALHRESPLCWGDSIPGFWRSLRGATINDPRAMAGFPILASERRSPPVYGPLEGIPSRSD